MPFKINISEKSGKSWKLESSGDAIMGKKLGEKLSGRDVSEELQGYEFEIRGASDIAGFPHKHGIEGPNLRKILLKKGWGMREKTKGLRRRKTLRGSQISEKTAQINLTISRQGPKSLKEIFPEQNKEPEKKEEKSEAKPEEKPQIQAGEQTEEQKPQKKAEEPKEKPDKND